MTRARVERLSRLAIAAALVAHTVMFVWVVAGRITFPFELEWMTGSVLDHVERVRSGLPIYTAPSARWVPFLYPPLYYWLCAPFGGSALACRLVSLACTAVELALAYGIARRLGASRFWSAAASGLFLACFSYVGWWYDLERTDSLYAALMMLGAAAALRARGPVGYALAGAVLGVGFLAKQQAVFYAAGAGFGLLLATRYARPEERARTSDVIAFGGAVVAGAGGGVAYAIHREGPWFRYYVLDMPRAHGILWHLAPSALGRDFGLGFALVGVTLAVGYLALRRLEARGLGRAELVFASMLGAGFAAAVASRLHIGGWINVLQPWTAFAAVATAVLASRLEAARAADPRVLPAIGVVLVAQLALWAYDPGAYCPPRKSRAYHEAFAARVRELETKGEVLVVARGHLTTPRHAHVSALADAIRVDGHAPKDLFESLSREAYAAIIDASREEGDQPVSDDWPPCRLEDFADVNGPLLSHYFIAERLLDDEVSLALRSPVRPIWVYLPRTTPIEGTPAELRTRQLAEMRLATALATARLAGRKLWFDGPEIERLAAIDVKSAH